MKKKAIVFTGFEQKLESILLAKERGFYTVLLTLKKKGDEDSIFDQVIEVDFYKRSSVDELVPYLRKNFNIKAIISNYEKYVVPRSYIAERLGVVGTPVYGACCSRNKILQRYALSVMPENIAWKKVKTLKGLQKAFKTFSDGVYLKFISGIKSRCIYHLPSESSLEPSWSEFSSSLENLDFDFQEDYKYLDFRFNYPNPRTNFLVEKATAGQQITVASFLGSHRVWNMPSVCDVYTAHSQGREDSFLAFRILPSKHSDFIIQEAHRVTETATQILGLRYCGIHSELIVTPKNEIKIIEIASRIGGYRERMYQEAYGISLAEQLIHVATGKDIKLPKKLKKYVSVIELFPQKQGTFEEIKNMQSVMDLDYVLYVKHMARKGEVVGLARQGFEPVAFLAVSGSTYDEVYERSVQIFNLCEVVIV